MAIPAGNGKRVREFFFHVEVGMKFALPQWKQKMASLELLVPKTPLQVRWIERQKLWGVAFIPKIQKNSKWVIPIIPLNS
jgi:hypothetical protein